MKKQQLKFTTVRGFIRYLRKEDRRLHKLSEESPNKTDSEKWMKGWLDGTSNAMGWAADMLRQFR